MSLVVLFVIVFVGGPLVFRALTRGGPSPTAFRRLAIFTALCAATGLTLRYGFTHLWDQNLIVTGTGIAFIWGGWIGVLAYGAQALRRMDAWTAYAPLDRRGRGRRNNSAVVRIGKCQPFGGLRG